MIYGLNNFANMYNLINQMHKFPWFMVGGGSHIKSMVALENIVDMTHFMLDKFFHDVFDNNTLGVLNLLNASRDMKPGKIILRENMPTILTLM